MWQGYVANRGYVEAWHPTIYIAHAPVHSYRTSHTRQHVVRCRTVLYADYKYGHRFGWDHVTDLYCRVSTPDQSLARQHTTLVESFEHEYYEVSRQTTAGSLSVDVWIV